MAKSSSKTALAVVLALGLMAASLGYAQEEKKPQTDDKARAQEAKKMQTSGQHEHVIVTPGELKWGAASPALPAGAQAAMLEGDPQKPGPYTIRAKMPANYKVPAHWHPNDEHVTVISGTLYMGMGDKLDTAQGKALTAGSYALMPAKTTHFAWTTEETILQLHGVGPWGITYVNPDDDPRKKPAN